MGIFSSIFGGTSYDQLPGSQKYIDALFGFDPLSFGLDTGIGKVGKWAKQDLKDFRAGKDVSQIAGLKGTLSAIDSAYATGDKARDREMAMSFAGLNQPELMAAQQAQLQRESNQDRANTIAGATGNFYNTQQNVFNDSWQAAQQRRALAAQLKLNALGQASSAQRNSYVANQTGGILNGLGSLGAGFSGAGSFINALR